MLRAAKVFVEYEPQTRIEGDLQQMDASFAVTELWQVLSGQAVGRENADQITLFDSVGFALEDFSALRFVHDQAQALRLGADVALIPALDDPKDLYQLVRPTAELRTTRSTSNAASTPQALQTALA